jgi:hypothetical protein
MVEALMLGTLCHAAAELSRHYGHAGCAGTVLVDHGEAGTGTTARNEHFRHVRGHPAGGAGAFGHLAFVDLEAVSLRKVAAALDAGQTFDTGLDFLLDGIEARISS